MVRTYERHGPTESFGVVSTIQCGSCVGIGKHAFVGANEDVLVWDMKTGELASMFHAQSHTSPVTALALSPTMTNRKEYVFAVGYADGSIRLFEWNTGMKGDGPAVKATFNGHRKSVNVLAWDAAGVRLASGGVEGEIVVWDVTEGVGMFRLHSHRLAITGLTFLPMGAKDQTHLLSSSRDTFLKLYHLPTQHCIETSVSHRSEILSFASFILPNQPQTQDQTASETYLISGGLEGERRLWRVDSKLLEQGFTRNEEGNFQKALEMVQALPSTSTSRAVKVQVHPLFPVVGVLSGGEKALELWRVRSEEEVMKKMKRRKKREKEKSAKGKQKTKGKQKEVDVEDEDETEDKVEWIDRITLWTTVRPSAGGKIKTFSFSSASSSSSPKQITVLLTLATNSLETYNLPYPPPKLPPTESPQSLQYSLTLPGHRTDVKSLSLSNDDEMLASVSNGSMKVWNVKTTKSIRTLECGHGLVGAWLKDNKFFVVATKAGALELYDIRESKQVCVIENAHTGPIWGLDVRPDGGGFVTGGKDGEVRFWDVQQTLEGMKLNHTRTMKMQDEVFSVKISPDTRLLAVSLLDSTIKVFFVDTMKFFLSLYGHKLPVLGMDISSDSKLLISCSSDKNIKIWGLDFGDCHRSLFAHDDVINGVRFEADSHLFWSVSRDKKVKYWDGDKFVNIQTLEGHNADVSALAVSHKGDFVVTASADKSIRVWEKLDDPLFLEEEREKELEKLYANEDLATRERDEARLKMAGQDEDGAVIEPESGEVRKTTAETLMAGERIVEALEIAEKDKKEQKMWEESNAKGEREARHPIFATMDNCGPEEYVLKVVERVNSASLYDALLTLHFDKIMLLIEYLDFWASKGWNIAIVSRITQFILRVHYKQLTSTRTMRTTLFSLRDNLQASIRREKEIVGFNLAALKFMQRQVLSEKTAEFFEEGGGLVSEEQVREKIQESSKKRKRTVMKS